MNTAQASARQTRAEKNAATSAALLAAAAETFAERGYEATSMDEIAQRVGLSKGALYYRYRSKEDLFLALLDERVAGYVAQLGGADRPEAAADEGWAGLAEHFRDVVREGVWPRLYLEFVAYATRSSRAREELGKRTRALRRAMERALEAQVARAGGELPVPAKDVALLISALGNGLALERLADPRAVPDRAFVELPGLLISALAHQPKEKRS
jgi:AcrR family transcriptional regulator